MKVKYRIADGEINAMGFMPDLQAGPGEAVADVEAAIPEQVDYFKFVDGAIAEKSQAEKDLADAKRKTFTPGSFMAKFNQTPDSAKLGLLANAVSKLISGVREEELP